MTALLRQRAFEAVGIRAMKILICGGDGQLDSDCVMVLQRKHEVVAVDYIFDGMENIKVVEMVCDILDEIQDGPDNHSMVSR